MNYVKSALKLELPRRPAVQDSATFSELMTLYNSLHLLHAQLSNALGLSQYTAQEASSVGLPSTARLGEMNTGTVQMTEAVAAGPTGHERSDQHPSQRGGHFHYRLRSFLHPSYWMAEQENKTALREVPRGERFAWSELNST